MINDNGRPLDGLRVAVLANAHGPSDARVVHKQAVSLHKLGCDVTVISAITAGKDAIDGLNYKTISHDERMHVFARLRRMRPLIRAARDSGAAIYHCHEPESSLAGIIAARKTKAKVVFDCHEVWQSTLSERIGGPVGWVVGKLILGLVKYVGKRSDWVTVVSPLMLKFYSDMRKDGRVDIIHNSPFVDKFPPCDQDVLGPVTIAHEGIIDYNRGMVQMLEALAIARKEVDIRMRFVGVPNSRSKDEFDSRIQQLGLRDIVLGPEWVSYDKVGAVLSTGQIGLVTFQPGGNTYGSLSNKLYNYMSCGMALIAPVNSATEQIVRQYDCGICVDTTKPAEIARAIVTLAKDPGLRKRLGANGRSAIERDLGWHRMEETLLKIFAQLASENAANRSCPPAHTGPAMRA